ncbi:hypothetical protein MINTM005_12890 [Mycobacterium intracellulare]|uniref:hypothetical protein n=1 Tax=Mycobacterium intracellulare TaxID=1767 RepID=UPI0019273876|nr:hypothetical protein [Mycobacterium intracellulare]BCO56045.1 hypothetical protein MINTM005_12890 [Mycobacterium intracellulare]
MTKSYKWALAGVIALWATIIILAMILDAPRAAADDNNCRFWAPCHTPWNGQLQPSWDAPGRYGWQSPVMCNPVVLQCQPYVPNP